MTICPCCELGLRVAVSCSTHGVFEELLGNQGHGMTLEGQEAQQERAVITLLGWDYEPDTWAWE